MSTNSPTPSTSSLPSTSQNLLGAKAYRDCQGILHDPEWKHFPTEEWKKQRREQRRSFYQHQRRASMEEDDGARYRTMSSQVFVDGDEEDEDEREYAFGGRKNRYRYRSFGYGLDRPRMSFEETSIPPTPATPALVLSRASTRSNDGDYDAEVPRTPKSMLGRLFKRKKSKEEVEFDEEDDVNVVPVNGLGLLGLDQPPPPYYQDEIHSPISISSTDSYDFNESQSQTSSSPSSPTSSLSSAFTRVRSKAHKQYLAMELSLTLGVVRTERRLKNIGIGRARGALGIAAGSF